MKPVKVFLTGFMGAGKTTLGRLLASRLGWDFQDLDEAIEAAEGLSVAGIFEERGEPHFRKAEARALASLAGAPGPAVIACGGGTPCDSANRDVMNAAGLAVWLDRPFDEIWRHRDELACTRPLLAHGDDDDGGEAELRAIYLQRRPMYELASLHVSIGDAGTSAALEQILRLLRERGAR